MVGTQHFRMISNKETMDNPYFLRHYESHEDSDKGVLPQFDASAIHKKTTHSKNLPQGFQKVPSTYISCARKNVILSASHRAHCALPFKF